MVGQQGLQRMLVHGVALFGFIKRRAKTFHKRRCRA